MGWLGCVIQSDRGGYVNWWKRIQRRIIGVHWHRTQHCDVLGGKSDEQSQKTHSQ
jgi:hypothetical protein